MIDRRRKTKDRYDLLIDGLFRIYEKALRISISLASRGSRSEDRAPQENTCDTTGMLRESPLLLRVKNGCGGCSTGTSAVPQIADDFVHRASRQMWAIALNRLRDSLLPGGLG